MIEVNGLTKRYGETLAVDNLSFKVEQGLVTGFLGPNGAGKSTTMRLILGLDNPDAGQALIDGKPYRELRTPIQTVGALLEAKGIAGGRSAYNHLRWVAQAGGLPKSRVHDVIEAVGLGRVIGRRVETYSLGMSQRLGIATALLGNPSNLLLDEPVNGLDPEGIVWIRNLLKQLAAEGRTILVSSHLMSEMEDTADHVLVIGRGKLLADTSMEAFIEKGAVHRVRVVSPSGADLRRQLEQAGATVAEDGDGAMMVTGMEAPNQIVLHELSPQRARLEAAFMEMTRGSVEYQAGLDQELRESLQAVGVLDGSKESERQ
jgi:ABC-2 type transport system ATP-binding protein